MLAEKTDWVLTRTLANQARDRGDQPFIGFEDGPMWTYAQVHRRVNAASNAFLGIDVQPGEQVILMLHNSLDYVWSWFGLMRIKATAVTVNTALKGRFLTHVLTNTKSRYAIIEPEFLNWVKDIEDDAPDLQRVYVMGGVPADAPAFQRLDIRDYAELTGAPETEVDIEVTVQDIGMVMFTSGTTGPSKAVLMPHGHLHLFGTAMGLAMGLTEADRYFNPMPLFHAQGSIMQTYGSMITGGSLVLAKQFRATTWIDEMRASGATVTNLLGVMNDFVLAQPERPTDSDNKLRAMCVLPVTDETLDVFRRRFGVTKFAELFGMTECNLPVWRPYDAPNEAGCSGAVWDEYFEVIIANPDTDEPVAAGEVGEILVRPKEPWCFMQGYNGMDDRTVETWRNFWFHTGDAGRFDERGYLWYIDRIKDTIRRRGENISSYEVEAVLLDHPAVGEVAAVAVKAEQGGEDEVLACIVLEAGAEQPDPAALLDFCAPRMPYFAVPRFIDFIDEIPKTPSSKIQKNKLRERGLTNTTWDREAAGYKLKRT